MVPSQTRDGILCLNQAAAFILSPFLSEPRPTVSDNQ